MENDFQHAQDMFQDDDLEESMAEVEIRPHILDNQSFLEELDIHKQLQIWHPKLQSEDQLVMEYMDLLKGTNFLPLPPTPEELAAVHTIPVELKSDKVTQVKVINFLSAFLTNTYHLKNVKSACERNLPLFVPKARFMVPNYSHLPLYYFEELKKFKELFACAIQSESIHAVQFTNELFLLRAFSTLQMDLTEKAVSADHIQYELKALFAVTALNFKKEHKDKVIDWDRKTSTIHGSLPDWRKKKYPPTTLVKNKYAEKLSKAILSNTVNLTSGAGHQEFTNFLEPTPPPRPPLPPTPTPVITVGTELPHLSYQNQTSRPPQQPPASSQPQPLPPPPPPPQVKRNKPNHRSGVPDYNSLFKVKKPARKENPHLMRRRGLAQPDVNVTNQPNAA